MRFNNALLTEELNQTMVKDLQTIKDGISKDEKLKLYIDEYQPSSEPYVYVLSKGKKYKIQCHLKWAKVAKRASEIVKDVTYQQETEENVADKVADRILTTIIGADFSEYNPKVKRNGIVIEVILSVPEEEKPQPANMQAQEEPITKDSEQGVQQQ